MAAQLPDMAATLAPGPQAPLPSLISSNRLKWQKIARALRLWVPAGILILLLFICFVFIAALYRYPFFPPRLLIKLKCIK